VIDSLRVGVVGVGANASVGVSPSSPLEESCALSESSVFCPFKVFPLPPVTWDAGVPHPTGR